MRLLLDTHALIWAAIEPARLSESLRASLAQGADELYVSAATAYEIDLKRSRDPSLADFPDDVEGYALSVGLMWLSITPSDACAAARLAPVHRDPWDRLIIAQAQAIRASVVTVDPWIAQYGVSTVW